MARIRTIKPEFWTSEQVGRCTVSARLLFIGLWNFSDDSGIHSSSEWRIKSEIFPMDICSDKDIRSWLDELIAQGLLKEYEALNQKYLRVTGWDDHQIIRKPYYRHPNEEGIVPKNDD